MKKRTVGIYAKYNASEQTLCANFLAAYVAKCYRYVKWHVPNTFRQPGPYNGFSHKWDREVIPWNKSKKSSRDVSQYDTFFFFERNEEIFHRLPKSAVSAYVLDPWNLSRENLDFARKCTYTLVLEQTWLIKNIQAETLENAICWHFDPAIPCIPRKDIDFEKEPKLFFPAFGFTPSQRKFARDVAKLVKIRKPNIRSVVGFYDARLTPVTTFDPRMYDWRLIRYLQNADWIVDLNPQPQYCLFPACAGGYGLQWIGYDISPNSEPCNAARRHLMPRAYDTKTEMNADRIAAILETPFRNELDRNRDVGAWDHRRAEFFRVTNMVLGIKTRI